jgi:hypothetical protein
MSSKGTAEAILAGMDSEEDEEKAAPAMMPKHADADDEGELAAASEFASATKSGDAKAILAAFKDMMETCGY